MSKTTKVIGVFGLLSGVAAGAWALWGAWPQKSSVLRQRIPIFSSTSRDGGWWTDWSWKCRIERPGLWTASEAPLIAQIEPYGGLAFRETGGEPLQLPEVGYLAFSVTGNEPDLAALAVSLHDGNEEHPVNGIRLTARGVASSCHGRENGRWLFTVPLSRFRPGIRVSKISLMNKGSGTVAVSLHEVALIPAEDQAERVIEAAARSATRLRP